MNKLNYKTIDKIVSHIVMISVLVIVLFPMLYAIIVSTQTFSEYFSFPPKLSPGTGALSNYSSAWIDGNLGRLLMNSLIMSLAVALGKIILSIFAAFSFVFYDFKGKGFFFIVVLITQMLPLPVRIVPTYQLMSSLHWVNTYWALTIPFFASATGTLLFRQLYMTVPSSFVDASRVDGASPIKFLWHVVLPLSKTNIAALFSNRIYFLYGTSISGPLLSQTQKK